MPKIDKLRGVKPAKMPTLKPRVKPASMPRLKPKVKPAAMPSDISPWRK